jgi:rod shape-determining protein MreC
MQNFLAFIRKFRVLLFFALLQGLALTLYFTFISFPRSQFMTTASSVSGTLLEWRNELTKHFALSENNTKLQKENISLRNKLPESYIQLQNDRVKINDTVYGAQYEYISATVINSTHDKRNNFFTLNVGKSQGVRRHDGVFTPSGVLGVVHNVSEHYSVVKSCLTGDINIDVLIDGSGEFGLLKWDGEDARYGTMTGVSNDRRIKKNAQVVTRGGAGIFPRGLPIGRIIETSAVEGKPLWNIKIEFSEDYRSVQRAYIVKNLLSKEQSEVENEQNPEE